MKKYIILSILIMLAGLVKGQVYQLMPQYGYDAKRMKFDSTLQIPTVCGVPTLKSNVLKYGAIAFDSCNKKLYAYDPKDASWAEVAGGSSDTTSLSNRINTKLESVTKRNDSVFIYRNGSEVFSFKDEVTDTTSLSNRINTKVPYDGAVDDVDLGVYNLSAHELRVTGTAGQGKIDLKKQSSAASTSNNSSALYSDASGNLSWVNDNIATVKLLNSHFTASRDLRIPDSAGTFALLSNIPDISGKLNISDTSTMLLPYLKAVDTASLSNRINAIDIDKVLDAGDSAFEKRMVIESSGSYVKMSNISNYPELRMDKSGYGVQIIPQAIQTFNISNSQTIALNSSDTAKLFIGGSSGFNEHELLRYPSLAENPNTFKHYLPVSTGIFVKSVNGVFADTLGNISVSGTDTTSLSNRINLKVNISDTANMLAPYLREADTLSISNRINAKLSITDTASMLSTYQRMAAFPIATFGGGSGQAGDTASFSTTSFYGSFYNAPTDTIVVTQIDKAVLSGTVSDTLFYNTSVSTSGATAIAVGTKIPPNVYVFSRTPAITSKPTYLSITLIGYRKRP